MLRKFIHRFVIIALFLGLFIPQCIPILQASSITSSTPSGIPLTELNTYIDSYVNEHIGVSTPGASVIVLKDNKIIHEKGYGVMDLATEQHVVADSTVFEWGSVSKLFVWVSIMQLAEQQKIDLQLPISTYLTEKQMPTLQYDEPITMLHLMNHTAGFEENINNLLLPSMKYMTSLEEGLKISEPYQAYRPGEVVAYSNYSTSLAALILENITGMSYEQYVKQNILEPLAMNDTVITIANEEELKRIEAKRATGYILGNDSFIKADFAYIPMYPSGGINGPATDLAKFANALLAQHEEDNKLFNDLSTLEGLYTATYRASEAYPINAHGFWINEHAGKYRSYFHGGNTIGFATSFHVVPDANFAVITLANQVAEYNIGTELVNELIDDSSLYASVNRLPLHTDINYEQSFVTSRKFDHSFLKVYYYNYQYKMKPLYEDNLLQLDYLGMTTLYEQIAPNHFRAVEDHVPLGFMQQFYLHHEEGQITKLNVTYADLLPSSISEQVTLLSLVLLLLLQIYILITMVIDIIRIFKRNKKQPYGLYALLTSLQLLSFINLGILAASMLANPTRALAEIMPHFYISYIIASVTVLLFIYTTYRAYKQRVLLRYHYIATTTVIVLYQAIIIFWRFYSV